MIVLSILTPTIPERTNQFRSLYLELFRQIEDLNRLHPTLGEVELKFDIGKRFLDGGLSIGKKREALVKLANGRYCNFLDDDEKPAPNYVETLVRLCHQEQDVCTFRAIAKLDNYWALFDMRLGQDNQQSTPYNTVLRMPFHTCPVRTEYAKRYSFEDVNYGEDALWMGQVLKDCRTEAHTDAILLQYNHSSKTSESDQITRHENNISNL